MTRYEVGTLKMIDDITRDMGAVYGTERVSKFSLPEGDEMNDLFENVLEVGHDELGCDEYRAMHFAQYETK
jgi:hypothetical protein